MSNKLCGHAWECMGRFDFSYRDIILPLYLGELAAGCNKLRFVDFTNCGQALTDLIIAALAQQCRGLKEVHNFFRTH